MALIDPGEWPMAADYFSGYTNGREDAYAHLRFIDERAELATSDDRDALFIGRAGADSIQFAYRKGFVGIWAHHPLEERWQWIANDIASLDYALSTGLYPYRFWTISMEF